MADKRKRISVGIDGLDEILQGGLMEQDSYLVRGGAGSGKTTIGLHFLIEGAKNNERVLFITLSEPKHKIIRNAKRREFDVSDVEFLDLSPSSDFIDQEEDYNVFEASEVERSPLLTKIIDYIESFNPQRLFIDGLTQLRFLSTDNYQFRKSILSLIQLMDENKITPMLVSEQGAQPDDDLQFICDAVINLDFENKNRIIHISKNRAGDFIDGFHAYTLNKNGMHVYPRLSSLLLKSLSKSSKEGVKKQEAEVMSSGIPELDKLMHGGIERGTTTIITGPTGAGKTSLGLSFMKEAAGRGEKSLVYLFEEEKEMLIERSKAINIPVDKMVEKGFLDLHSINQLEFNPDKFIYQVKEKVDNNEVDIVMIDSINSFTTSYLNTQNNMKLIKSLNALNSYLSNQGVTVVLTNEIANITGDLEVTDDKISYLADNVVLLRYIEVEGSIKKAIGVLKKRLSNFETRLRDFKITEYGLEVGQPLENLQGVLTGTPQVISKFED
ncbi:MAG: ATPase domain-containing protein [Bacillota bacterium]